MSAHGSTGIVFKITIDESATDVAADIEAVSRYTNEKEVLVSPYTTFVVENTESRLVFGIAKKILEYITSHRMVHTLRGSHILLVITRNWPIAMCSMSLGVLQFLYAPFQLADCASLFRD
eukprot:c9248_g1_i2.p1 GENE.c9248_g1_i2~~c9248_g1_i2.p1  ORF type:complete len:120 (-),score=26.48 c9248_g1_i2:216-575(-)